MKYRNQLIWLLFVVIIFVACGEEAVETPTTNPPTPTEIAIVATAMPTATDTAIPEATATATNTAVPEPTMTATAVPEAEPTLTAVSQPAELIIHQPGTLTELPVEQEIIINGDVLPAQAAEVEVRLIVAGDEMLLSETAVADESGRWQVTAVLPPQIVGPAEVEARIVNSELRSVNEITLVPNLEADQTTIWLTKPDTMSTAVVGYTLLFEGQVTQPIAETITIAVLEDNCTAVAASQSFMVSGGAWFGFTIVSANAQPGPACAIAYTGERGSEDSREYRVPLNLVSADDPMAIILELGNADEMTFTAGNSTALFGVAINAPDNEVNIRLESDDPSRPSDIVASGVAFANQYGFWEIDLAIPAEAQGSALFYVTSGNNDENYREIRIPVTIQ